MSSDGKLWYEKPHILAFFCKKEEDAYLCPGSRIVIDLLCDVLSDRTFFEMEVLFTSKKA